MTGLSQCRGMGSGPHGFFAPKDLTPAAKVLGREGARGGYCDLCRERLTKRKGAR